MLKQNSTGSTAPIRFAVVGCGHIGKRHAAIIQQHEECVLTALCDIRPEKDLAVEAYEAPFFSSIEALLNSGTGVDVISICTPNGLHAAQSIAALDAYKHVICEKPMGLTKASCEEVIFKALNVSKQVFCVMQNRYSPPAVWLKSVIDQQLLGEIFLVEVNCYWNRDERYYCPGGKAHPWKGTKALDGGTLFTQFSHFIDLLYWLFGDIRDIRTRLANFNHGEAIDFEDSGIVAFHFVKGGMGCLTYSTSVWDANMESSITVIGSNGTIKVGGQYMNEVLYCHIRDYKMPELPAANPPNEYAGYKGSAANHHFVIQNVVDVLKGRQVATTNALEGMKVVEIIERIYSSI